MLDGARVVKSVDFLKSRCRVETRRVDKSGEGPLRFWDYRVAIRSPNHATGTGLVALEDIPAGSLVWTADLNQEVSGARGAWYERDTHHAPQSSGEALFFASFCDARALLSGRARSRLRTPLVAYVVAVHGTASARRFSRAVGPGEAAFFPALTARCTDILTLDEVLAFESAAKRQHWADYTWAITGLFFGPRRDLPVDDAITLEASHYLNHSCNANVGFATDTSLVAIRDIAKGEEIRYVCLCLCFF